ncbi:dynamin family protein [Williamsia deligens]|uniref:Dynamin family protein n=1 Tax=Williamsia deligens TaxID=321325 RepID=A0ABW3G470_9NOCA|nr:dynamin family protein [Williamsia deligens]MCP2194208.1 Replication fork clamp-binding protein CrfC (dynamin-like GTPase family) [Williamsia deligens]
MQPTPVTPGTPAQPSAEAQLEELLRQMSQVAAGLDREDLVARLEGARTRIVDPRLRIVVVGQLKQGKSQFVNSLLDMEVCSVGDDETTAVPTLVQNATTAAAHLVLDEPGAEPTTVEIPVADIRGITPDTPHAQGRPVIRLEVSAPNPLLADGLVLVDTPGVGGHGNPHAASTLGLIPSADAVLMVSDASQEFTEPEVAFLKQVTALCPTVACLVSKTDLYPHWRRIVEADGAHLAREGIDVPLLPISSLLRSHALRRNDAGLMAESGFTELYAFLRDRVVAHAEQTTRASVALDLRSVSEHLALTLGSELAALRDPETAAAALDGLRRAQTAAEEMQQRTSRWQQTLADGIADLAGDVDHDLRDRLRAVTREAEKAVDEGDPGKDWPQLSEWLADQIASAVGDNFVWAHEQAAWLAGRVADHFAETAKTQLPDLDIADIDGVFAPVTELADLESGRLGIGQKALIGLRGSYGGVLMFGLITTLMGLALINPISVGAGVLLGSKAYRDDKGARVDQRRMKAKQAIHAFTDDVSFQVGKESRDRLRHVQRELRDHFVDVADQAARSVSESLRAAQEAAQSQTSLRASRTAELEQQLRAVAALRTVSDRLEVAAGPTRPAVQSGRHSSDQSRLQA